MLYSSWLLVIYFPEIYISVLTSIIEISTCDSFLNNNILIQSMIFLPVLSKYVQTRIRNIFPIQKKDAMIWSIRFEQIFSKSKTNMDEDKKKNFRMELVKKGLIFAATQYAVLKFTHHWCFVHVQLKLWNSVFASFCF